MILSFVEIYVNYDEYRDIIEKHNIYKSEIY